MPGKIHHACACIASLGLCCFSIQTGAQEVAEIPFFYTAPGTAALGGGIRGGQDMYFENTNEDLRTRDLIPLYLYEGKWLYSHGTAAGVHLFRNDSFQANVHVRYRFQKLNPDSNEFYAGLEERKQSLDAGLQLQTTQRWGQLRLTAVHDTLSRHQGTEIAASYRYFFDAGRWNLSPFITWGWQDDNLSNYYFGVSEAEARPDRPAHDTGDSQWVNIGLNTAWHATDKIVLFANFGFGGPDSGIENSPLVEEAGYSGVFVGGTYVFGNALKSTYIMDPERAGEWAWRVNYGYQADGNIVSEIDQGDFSKSTFADTNIGGITLSKLLSAGPRIDYLGKFALFRHFEEDEGNGNFWSYNAYIMARGKGYSPWSKEEWFRWGFGFGMSYAEEVPIAEQRKQAEKGENTSKFLNYLEMTLDFPLRRISKAKWLQRCYAGLTIVHRSGIFGTSDLLGDVSGGSDWITAHLECTQ